jgi:Leucine-rich repeat (LRR) protein
MKKTLLVTLLLLFIFPLSNWAQMNVDSTKYKNNPKYKHLVDSTFKALNKIALEYERRQDSIRKIKQLERIKLLSEQNPDTTFDIKMGNLAIEKMPDISRFTNVKQIDLRNNKIDNISKNIWPEADSLHSVNFENNELKRISFKRNSHIETLNLSHNHFKRIPRSILKLKHLKSIDLSRNEIKRIPCFIQRMDSLEELKLNYNQLGNLSKREIRRLRNIPKIHLGFNNINRLPENIDVLRKAKVLNLGRNQLSSLPSAFSQLDSLQHLILYQNNFDSIPQLIFQLKELVELDFYYNHLTEIPEEIGELEKLQQIFMAYNKISSIPNSIFGLKHLKALYLHHNQIILIPEAIVNMDELMYLDLGYNKIFEIPDMSGMRSLKEVDFQENNLAEFPYELLENKKLTHIFLMGNTFVMTKEERAEMEKLREELSEIGIRFYF